MKILIEGAGLKVKPLLPQGLCPSLLKHGNVHNVVINSTKFLIPNNWSWPHGSFMLLGIV